MQRVRTWQAFLIFVVAAMFVMALSTTAFATEDLEPGTYTVDAEFSAYVSAMGGIEFGTPVFDGATVTVDDQGNAAVTMGFKTGSLVIYGVTANLFVDPEWYAAPEWGPAEYKTGGAFVPVTSHTIDESITMNRPMDTTPPPSSPTAHPVDSITFPVDVSQDEYELAIVVNSQVMGNRFGYPASSGNIYYAYLTIDWNSATPGGSTPPTTEPPTQTGTQSATVEYTVTGRYEVSIPATIVVDSATKIGEYSVEAADFLIPESAYVTVSADTEGTVAHGSNALTFTNALSGENLEQTGDTLDGVVTITQNPSVPGEYTGTIDFEINYYSGE